MSTNNQEVVRTRLPSFLENPIANLIRRDEELLPFEIFYQFSQIPRPSGEEEQIREWIKSLALKYNWNAKVDSAGNLMVKVPASKGRESCPTLLIQNHLDMVCDYLSNHKDALDPKTNALSLFIDTVKQGNQEEHWMLARHSTLGADNGMGCALALALALDPAVEHPALELFFTVDEESGLHGALNFDPGLISARIGLNLDTEDWGEFFVGCAGGRDILLKHNNPYSSLKAFKEVQNDLKDEWKNFNLLTVQLSNLQGGHSGVDIHRSRGNAIKLLSEGCIRFFLQQESLKSNLDDRKKFEQQLFLLNWEGGKTHNIIPPSCSFSCLVHNDIVDDWNDFWNHFVEVEWPQRLPEEDLAFQFQQIELSLSEGEQESLKVVDYFDWFSWCEMLSLLPHGPSRLQSQVFPGEKEEKILVRLSNNLAKAVLKNGETFIQTSLRFTHAEEIAGLMVTIQQIAEKYDFSLEIQSGYPSWAPEFKGQWINYCLQQYLDFKNTAAKVNVIHAGLECGLLKEKIPDLQLISLGPTIRNAHSVKESVYLETVIECYRFLKHLVGQPLKNFE